MPAPTESPDDFDVAARVRDAESHEARVAFDTLCVRYAEPLWRFAYRFLGTSDLARDVVQDVFVALWLGRTRWTPTSTVRAYLFGAVRNRALKQIRHDTIAERAETHADVAGGESWYGRVPDPPDVRAEQRELHQAARAAIVQLPERQRLAVELRWQHAMGWTEIGEVMGVSEAAARKLVHAAAARLATLRTTHLDG